MLSILSLVLKSGFKTSELWVTVAGLLVTFVSPFVPGWVNSLHAQQVNASPGVSIALGLAAALISGTYTVARTLTKGRAVEAAASTIAPADPNVIETPSGNVMTPGPGSASLEEAHRAAIVAATSALEDAHKALLMASNLARPSSFSPAAPPAPAPAASAIANGAGGVAAASNPAPVPSSSSSSGGPTPGPVAGGA